MHKLSAPIYFPITLSVKGVKELCDSSCSGKNTSLPQNWTLPGRRIEVQWNSCESQLVKCPTLCTYGSQALQPVSTSTLRSAKCLIKFLVRFFSCTQCRIRRPGKGTCPNEQPLAVLYCGELKAFGSALGLRCCLNHSISTWITQAGKASELPRELKALAYLTWKTLNMAKFEKKNKAPSKFPERNPLNLLPSSSQIAKDSESIYYRLRPQHYIMIYSGARNNTMFEVSAGLTLLAQEHMVLVPSETWGTS